MSAIVITNPRDAELVITRTFTAPRQLIWDCHTKPDLVRRWLLGPDGWIMPVCEIDLRVGGAYRYEWRNANGREMGMGGTYREIGAPQRLVNTELFDEDWTGGEVLTTLELLQDGPKTLLTNTGIYSSQAALEAALKTGMTTGIDAGYARIDAIAAELA